MIKNTQNTETPWMFIKALEQYFGIRFMYDMAADKKNSKAPFHYNEYCNSLTNNWPIDGNLFLNPQFKVLTDWVNKCKEQKDRWCKIYGVWPLSSDLNQIPVFKEAQMNIIHGRVWPGVRGCVVSVWDKEADVFGNPIHGLRWNKQTLTRIW